MAATDWFAQNAPQPAAAAPAAPPAPAGGGGGDWFAQNAPAAGGASAAPAAAPAAAAPAGGAPDNPLDPTGIGDDAMIGLGRHAVRSVVGLSDAAKKHGHVLGFDIGAPVPQLPAIPGHPSAPQQESHFFQQMREFANQPDANAAQVGGGMLENLGEWLTAEKAIKYVGPLMEGAEALKGAADIHKVLSNHPILAKIVMAGEKALSSPARQALISGAQTYVKTGGDMQAAIRDAALAGGTGLVLEAGGSSIVKNVAQRAATVEDVGGVATQIPSIIRNAEMSPEQVQGQQSIKNAAKDALGRNLQEVNESRTLTPPDNKQLTTGSDPYEFNLQGNPPDVTPATTIKTGPAWVPAAQSTPVGHAPQEGPNYSFSGSDIHAKPIYVTSPEQTPTKPGNVNAMGADVSTTQPRPVSETIDIPSKATGPGTLRTQDPNVVREHIATLNQAIEEAKDPAQKAQLITARQEAQRQMAEYHELQRTRYPGYQRPNFEQIDIPKEMEKTNSWPEVAAKVKKTATDGWDHLNDITGGKFNALKAENEAAWLEYKQAAGGEAQDAAYAKVADSNRKMDDLLTSINHAVTPKELSGFSGAYKNAQVVQAVSDAVEGSFTGNASPTARAWEKRGFDGNTLMNNLSDLQRRLGRAKIDRVVGRENFDTLFQVAELNRTPAQRTQFGQAENAIAAWLDQNGKGMAIRHLAPIAVGGAIGKATGVGWTMGALAGEASALAIRKVTDSVLANPKVAKNLIYAIQYGADPKHYAPFIGSMIQTSMDNKPGAAPQSQQQPTQQPQAQATAAKPQRDPYLAVPSPKGLVEKGNLQIWNRPTVQNDDKTHSTEYSTSFNEDGKEVLVPTIVDGKFLAPGGKKPPEGSAAETTMFKEAWKHYKATGENLGKFDSIDNANAYAKALHNRGEQ